MVPHSNPVRVNPRKAFVVKVMGLMFASVCIQSGSKASGMKAVLMKISGNVRNMLNPVTVSALFVVNPNASEKPEPAIAKIAIVMRINIMPGAPVMKLAPIRADSTE